MDKPGLPPDPPHKLPSFPSSQPDPQKSPPFIDASPKAPPTPVDSSQKTEKPPLSNLPPKPLLKDLPPKPHIADLPPQPPLSDRCGPPPRDAHRMRAVSVQQGALSPRPAAEELPPGTVETPVPLPRRISSVSLYVSCCIRDRAGLKVHSGVSRLLVM